MVSSQTIPPSKIKNHISHVPQSFIYLTPRPKQPPKRKSGGAAESGASGKAARQSKLAKEHDITAQEEAEIKEAFSLFSEPMDGEKEGVIPIDDVRRAMMCVCRSFSTPPPRGGPLTFAQAQRNRPSKLGWPRLRRKGPLC